jgi:hypothetical protein
MAGAQEMKLGGCQCGAVRFDLRGSAQAIYACHCTECRKQSASAFGISVIHAPEDLSISAGAPKSWTRMTAKGEPMQCWFCEDCGSRLWHAAGGIISIKGGSLDNIPDVETHIWTASKLPWVVIPTAAEQWPHEPER